MLPEELVSFCTFELQTEETEGTSLVTRSSGIISGCPSRAHHGSVSGWQSYMWELY